MIGRLAPRALCVLACCAILAGCQGAGDTKAPAAAAATAPATTAAVGTVTFAGGDGSSVAEAILVKAPNETAGVPAEYRWLDDHLPGFRFERQSLMQVGDRHYDQFDGVMPNGQRRSVFFDITEFFGKL